MLKLDPTSPFCIYGIWSHWCSYKAAGVSICQTGLKLVTHILGTLRPACWQAFGLNCLLNLINIGVIWKYTLSVMKMTL